VLRVRRTRQSRYHIRWSRAERDPFVVTGYRYWRTSARPPQRMTVSTDSPSGRVMRQLVARLRTTTSQLGRPAIRERSSVTPASVAPEASSAAARTNRRLSSPGRSCRARSIVSSAAVGSPPKSWSTARLKPAKASAASTAWLAHRAGRHFGRPEGRRRCRHRPVPAVGPQRPAAPRTPRPSRHLLPPPPPRARQEACEPGGQPNSRTQTPSQATHRASSSCSPAPRSRHPSHARRDRCRAPRWLPQRCHPRQQH
jgi:hypothetical protein